MRTWIYARVSTLDQYLTGNSIEAQVKSCLEYAERNDLFLGESTNCGRPGVFLDGGKSAYTKRLMERPGGQLLLDSVRSGDTIIATATHRLFRKTSDMLVIMEKWVQQGVSVVFTDYPMLSTNTANGRAMLSIFAVIAQLKSELMSARIKEAFVLRKEQGKTVRLDKRCTFLEKVTPVSAGIRDILQEVARERDKSKFCFTGKVRAYARVSTKEQTVDQQKDCILKHLPPEMSDAEIVWYVDEGVSAYKTSMTKRGAGGALLNDLQEGDIVVTWRPDRIFRSLLDMANTVELIHSKGASLHTVEGGIRTDTPFGRTMVSLLSMLAEVESQEISRSTKQGNAISLAKGGRACKDRMPAFLRPMKDETRQVHFSFVQVITPEERKNLYTQLALTRSDYSSTEAAGRFICNQFLVSKGLPPLRGADGDPKKRYIRRLERMQKEEHSKVRAKVLHALKKYGKDTEVRYPICMLAITQTMRYMDEFLSTAKRIRGQIKEKQTRVLLANSSHDREGVLDLMNAVTPVESDRSVG
jgi:DNA invertase Pin-like site-specific DNA recombinase